MKITKEYYICDRCKEELFEKPIIEYDNMYYYELCCECDDDFKEYKDKVKELEEKFDEITKKYKFGKYLNKEEIK